MSTGAKPKTSGKGKAAKQTAGVWVSAQVVDIYLAAVVSAETLAGGALDALLELRPDLDPLEGAEDLERENFAKWRRDDGLYNIFDVDAAVKASRVKAIRELQDFLEAAKLPAPKKASKTSLGLGRQNTILLCPVPAMVRTFVAQDGGSIQPNAPSFRNNMAVLVKVNQRMGLAIVGKTRKFHTHMDGPAVTKYVFQQWANASGLTFECLTELKKKLKEIKDRTSSLYWAVTKERVHTLETGQDWDLWTTRADRLPKRYANPQYAVVAGNFGGMGESALVKIFMKLWEEEGGTMATGEVEEEDEEEDGEEHHGAEDDDGGDSAGSGNESGSQKGDGSGRAGVSESENEDEARATVDGAAEQRRGVSNKGKKRVGDEGVNRGRDTDEGVDGAGKRGRKNAGAEVVGGGGAGSAGGNVGADGPAQRTRASGNRGPIGRS